MKLFTAEGRRVFVRISESSYVEMLSLTVFIGVSFTGVLR